MVLKKRLDYGFNGYQVPVIPRGPRSIRRRSSQKKEIEDSQICAFELLAVVAGKLLQESESSASSNADEGKNISFIHRGGIKREKSEDGKVLKPECLDQASCIEGAFLSEVAAHKCNLKSTVGEFPNPECDTVMESTSIISGSDFPRKVGHDVKLEVPENLTAFEKLPGKIDDGSPNCGESSDACVDNRIEQQLEVEGYRRHNTDLATINIHNSEDPEELCVNTSQLVNSDSSVQLTSYMDSVPNVSFPEHRSSVNLAIRDDDEKYVVRNWPNSKMRAFRPQPCTGRRRIRKLPTSRYWKVAPKLKDYEFPNTNGVVKRISCNRKGLHSGERIQREGHFKKRKLFGHSLTAAYNREGSSESISNSPEKGMKGGKSGLAMKLHRVKFSIKSFKVPELYVDVPETATIGSLKRTVMEAVTAILQGGLHVGVLFQGKKVRDDNRTLLQSGISHKHNLDTLGFTLEPSSVIASPPVSPQDPPAFLPCETDQQSTRSPAGLISESGFSNASHDPPPAANVDGLVECNKEMLPPPTDVQNEGPTPDSKALVPVPAMNVEALAVVPVNQKARRTELVQRRTRRPFSVSEVEALVEAVEQLGTGRWRDVKLRAFEDADHRTYVDLKDKWKTLVHTASISPQQRRGEPVPQELLDRVLAAHAYWSQHQSKQHGHGKHQSEPLKLLDAQVGGT
ncbi:telomere repeat-binding protein 4 isoform X2 [Diospyros lotus]|uniref:telomere repeat-binding protein 4 isoform X2 n=1 Tax=Diospyros lotus TaxID=55363 RepID=UPI002258C32B|nr:telomere repeat-binding protein 4 isoform X2 [Diospyros lotus]